MLSFVARPALFALALVSVAACGSSFAPPDDGATPRPDLGSPPRPDVGPDLGRPDLGVDGGLPDDGPLDGGVDGGPPEQPLAMCDPLPEPTAAGCAPSCGDGIRTLGDVPASCRSIFEDGEACDGAALGGLDCVALGFDSGTLRCSAGCSCSR